MKTSNSVLSAVVVSVLGISATLGAPQALAVDYKNYPGEMCIKWSGAGTTYLNWGSIGNNSSTGWVYLECPTIRDGKTIYSGWVRATDQNHSYNIKCMLYSSHRDPNNSAVVYQIAGTQETTRPSGNGYQYLGYGGTTTASWDEHNVYSCSIPPTYNGNASEIHTYMVSENGSTE